MDNLCSGCVNVELKIDEQAGLNAYAMSETIMVSPQLQATANGLLIFRRYLTLVVIAWRDRVRP